MPQTHSAIFLANSDGTVEEYASAPGADGHIIQNSSGSPVTVRPNVQYGDAFKLSDNPTQDATVVGVDNNVVSAATNLGPVETSSIAAAAHQSGEIFIWQGQLVKATAAINAGDTIGSGNVTATSVNEEFKGISPNLAGLADTHIDNPQSSQVIQYDAATQKYINGKKLPFDLGVSGGQYGYYNASNQFVAFKSQADIDAAVAAAMVGDATAADVLATKTFTNSTTSGVTGSMTNRGAVNQTLTTSTTSYTVPQGYHNGSGTVKIVTETKTEAAGTSNKTVTPTSGKVLSSVTIQPTPSQSKSTTSSRSAQTITPDSGKLLSSVSIAKYPDASGTYTATSRSSALDMGATNNLRYVDTTGVPNSFAETVLWTNPSPTSPMPSSGAASSTYVTLTGITSTSDLSKYTYYKFVFTVSTQDSTTKTIIVPSSELSNRRLIAIYGGDENTDFGCVRILQWASLNNALRISYGINVGATGAKAIGAILRYVYGLK